MSGSSPIAATPVNGNRSYSPTSPVAGVTVGAGRRTPTTGAASVTATPNSVNVPLTVEQERAVVQFAKRAQEILYSSIQIRASMEEIDKQYQREKNWTDAQLRARIANRVGDAHKIQDITVPIVMPQVESCMAYLTNVFLTGYPIFGVSAGPAEENAALMMETIIGENSITAGWIPEIMRFFRDGLKYNLHCLEVRWDQKTVWGIETDANRPNSAAPKEVLWNGNTIKRIDLYNAFWDYRCHPYEIADYGEFAGYTRLYSRARMKAYINDISDKITPATAKRALEAPVIQFQPMSSTLVPFGYYQPLINPFPTLSPANSMMNFDWHAWATDKRESSIDYKDAYTVTTVYGRIIPDDFGLRTPGPNTPQVWRFTIINGSVVLEAERQSNAHSKIPMFFGQPLSDGLDYQTKTFAQNVVPMQEVASALWSGFLASKRRLVTDRVLYDPSRVRESDINSPNPSAKIPIRPSAYGKPLQEAVYQFPFRDEQANSFVSAASQTVNFANMINNQNPAQQGQFVKGNKTKEEYDDVMGHGNGSNQMMAINIEGQVFTPIKEVLKLNMLQYQKDGVIFNSEQKTAVAVNQQTMRQAAVQFKISDGILPEEKEMDTDEFQTALQAIGSSPQIGAAYNIGPMFTYVMKLRGADLSPFEKSPAQMQYEQAMQAWQQAAELAAKAGSPFSTPQPQPSPQLQQEMQQAQQSGGVDPKSSQATANALSSTQGT